MATLTTMPITLLMRRPWTWPFVSSMRRMARLPCSPHSRTWDGAHESKYPGLGALRVFRVTGFEDMLILYRPLSKGVDILRVVHGSRNLRALLRREGLE